jgi:hypothetical protein
MTLLLKAAVGIGGTLILAGAYTFHQGVLRVDVDEYRPGGSHLHLWVPAAAVPMAMHFVPREKLKEAREEAHPVLPTARAIVKELQKFPDADFIEVVDGEQHVQIRTHRGHLEIYVKEPGQKLHVLCPLATLNDVTSQLDESAPGV